MKIVDEIIKSLETEDWEYGDYYNLKEEAKSKMDKK